MSKFMRQLSDTSICRAQVENPVWEHSLFLKLFITTSGGW